MTENLEPLFRSGPTTSAVKGILLGFTAALCWWIGIAGTINNAAGVPYLVVPALVTALAIVAMRPATSAEARRINSLAIRRPRIVSPRVWAMVALLCGFTALLSWWVAIVALVVIGGGMQAILFFLFVPIATTLGTLLAARSAGWVGKGVRRDVEP